VFYWGRRRFKEGTRKELEYRKFWQRMAAQLEEEPRFSPGKNTWGSTTSHKR